MTDRLIDYWTDRGLEKNEKLKMNLSEKKKLPSRNSLIPVRFVSFVRC